MKQLILDELDLVFGDSNRDCSVQDVAELKYLECCIKETLRLYPSVPAIMRCLTEDIEIGKKKQKKTCILILYETAAYYVHISSFKIIFVFILFHRRVQITCRCFSCTNDLRYAPQPSSLSRSGIF